MLTNETHRKIKYIASKNGLQLKDIAEQLQIHENSFSMYLTGRANWKPEHQEQLAEFLNCDFEWLFSDNQFMIPEYQEVA